MPRNKSERNDLEDTLIIQEKDCSWSETCGKYHCPSQEIITIISNKFGSRLNFILFETEPHKSPCIGQRNSIICHEGHYKVATVFSRSICRATDSHFIPWMIRKSRLYFRNIIQTICLAHEDCEKGWFNWRLATY